MSEQENDNQEQEVVQYSNDSFWDRVPCWVVSMVVHTILLVAMVLIQTPAKPQAKTNDLVASTEEVVEEEVQEEEIEEVEEIDLNITEDTVDDVVVEDVANDSEVDIPDSAVAEEEAPPAFVAFEPLSTIKGQSTDANATLSAYTSGTGLSGRGNADAIALRSGGSAASQKAVALGLLWISKHQCQDGSWNYNHLMAGGGCNCSGPGSLMKATNAATAMGILPFLGCGQTHKTGKYKGNIYKGLTYLCRNMKADKKIPGGSLRQDAGTMYGHGLATICLTEAYAMTKDKSLRDPAQAAVNFIMSAQDPAGGGWRYEPRQAGDTSVVGWQMMALKSGYMGYLKVDARVAQKAMHFLDSVQQDSGSYYGYTTPGKTPACTAIGLLCRMYYGWKQDNPALQRGAEYLSALGPSSDPYYNYYATQVMRHYGGNYWTKWNNKMRDQLVNSQSKDEKSHEYGSWPMSGGHGTQGGRLYSTAMSVMTLEVYYRHMPIYNSQSTEGDLSLD